MAYGYSTNLPTDPNKIPRAPYDQVNTHRWFAQHAFDTQILNTPSSFKALLKAQGKTPMPFRTHVEISNFHGTAKIYVARGGDTSTSLSTSVYQWVLIPVSGYLKEPFGQDHDFYIVSDTNGIGAMITELA